MPMPSPPDDDAPVRLDHAAITTPHLDGAVAFYVDLLGLRLHGIEADPIRKGRRRALLLDAHGHEVLELIEMPELEHPAIPGRGGLHHLGFRLPRRAWLALRTRLDAARYPYQEIQQRLFVRDTDGLILEIEQDDHSAP
ncbi:MAG: VOC family protein [Bacteroidetes bacterium]|nr:MAG: VOC family protein [Bacteroidota bacterium]GIV57241.1 MAG: glyoxalase [Rhodothermaceae bacterium]